MAGYWTGKSRRAGANAWKINAFAVSRNIRTTKQCVLYKCILPARKQLRILPSTIIAMTMRAGSRLLFHNGKILTNVMTAGSNQTPQFVDSMLIEDDLIVDIGQRNSVAASAEQREVEKIDLAGLTVLPGFIDGHMHLFLLGQSLQKLNLEGCSSLEDIRAAIRSYAVSNPQLPRILCRGWMPYMTPAGATAEMLDDIDPRPVFIDARDLHSTWCNSAALQELNVGNMPDPAGGRIHRRSDGSNLAAGVLSEGAVFSIVWPHQSSVASIKERKEAILAALSSYHEQGYTGLVEMAMDMPVWQALQELRAEIVDLPMRVAAYWYIKPTNSAESRLEQVECAIKLMQENEDEDLRIVGIKIMVDGVVDTCTAFVTEPYLVTGLLARPTWSQDALEPVVKAADLAGLQVALHAIGDAAVKTAIDVLEQATPGRRHRIEHLELTSPGDAQRLGRLNITASIQPAHADPVLLKAWPELLGEERCKRAFAYREFIDNGALMALGSDSPTAPWEVMKNLYVACTRRSIREPESEEAVNENFRLGLHEAVMGATYGAASSVFDEARTGSLEVGKKADFVIMDIEWKPSRLRQATVQETWFGGRRVWRRNK